MPWMEQRVSEQRIRFVLRAGSGNEEMAGLCREFGISRPTGYLWLKRFRENGRIEELAERSRRPNRIPGKTPEAIETRVVEERKRRPDWGARKLQVVLKRAEVELPPVTIHRILQRNRLILPHNQHRPALKRFQREQPNQLWQTDFKGLPANLSKGCSPLSMLDDCSRFCLELKDLNGTKAEPVRQTFEEVFEEHGLPDGMLLDHGTPWWNANHPWGWTSLSIWLMKKGIRLHFCAVRHPQTQGKVERFHRSMEDALNERGFPSSREEWGPWLSAFRQEYNQERPHEALAMKTPAEYWKPSSRRPEAIASDWEYEDGSQVMRVGSSGQIRYAQHAYMVSGALSGEWIELKPLTADRLLLYYRRTCVREINLQKRQSYPVYFSREERVFEDD